MRASELQSLCERSLSSAVDDDTREYIVSLLSDEDTDAGSLGPSEIAELVAPLLDGGAELATELANAVVALYSGSATSKDPPEPPRARQSQSSTRLLSRTVLLGSNGAGGEKRAAAAAAETETETETGTETETETETERERARDLANGPCVFCLPPSTHTA